MPLYMVFLLAAAVLVVGYFIYGTFVEKVFGARGDRPTPVRIRADFADYVEIRPLTLWLTQLVNTTGVTLVVGFAIGALYGPLGLLGIALGSVFAGAVHDYLAGMLSIRYGGASVPDIVGRNLGVAARQIMRVFTVLMLVLVGVVSFLVLMELLLGYYSELLRASTEINFPDGPLYLFPLIGLALPPLFRLACSLVRRIFWLAELAGSATRGGLGRFVGWILCTLAFWVGLMVLGSGLFVLPVFIFPYYFRTITAPADKFAGLAYSLAGALLIIGVLSIILYAVGMGDTLLQPADWTMPRSGELPLGPLVGIATACGALSGFSAAQSPLMARCMGNERQGRTVFYGAMIVRGFILLACAVVGMISSVAPQSSGAATIESGLLAAYGPAGALLGSIILPKSTLALLTGLLLFFCWPLLIISCSSALRIARLTVADMLGMAQEERAKRMYLAVPLYLLTYLLATGVLFLPILGINPPWLSLDGIWRCVVWLNQILAVIILWTGAVYLYRHNRLHWIATVPAVLGTAAGVAYVCCDPVLGLTMGLNISYGIGAVVAALALAALLMLGGKGSQPDN